MAKTRAQRKAERRRREAQQQRSGGTQAAQQSEAQHRTQVPESADVIEAELAEHGADLEALKDAPREEPGEGDGAGAPAAPAPSRADIGRPADAAAPTADTAPTEDKLSRRARRQAERERKEAAKESARRRERRDEPTERQRGAVAGFFSSVMAELRRVQWPDRETLIQATGITIIFIAVMAAYLGVLDAIFNEVVQAIL